VSVQNATVAGRVAPASIATLWYQYSRWLGPRAGGESSSAVRIDVVRDLQHLGQRHHARLRQERDHGVEIRGLLASAPSGRASQGGSARSRIARRMRERPHQHGPCAPGSSDIARRRSR
jgi:hypothetical protein